MKVIGLDIGGANLKACGLEINESGYIEDNDCTSVFFPIWQHARIELWKEIVKIVHGVSNGETPDLISVVMTAELSDVFQTKREGVLTIARNIVEVLDKFPIVFPSVDLDLYELTQVEENPLSIAAANWSPLAWMIGLTHQDCIHIDIGSTTTDVITIRDGLPKASGNNDTSRLIHGELVYTGALRTDLSAILQKVLINQGECRVSSEYFSTSADVHLVLGHITEKEYSIDTADSRGKSKDECMARIARLICGDNELISKDEIMSISEQIWKRQISDISEAILQVCEEKDLNPKEEKYVVSGMGSEFLAQPAIHGVGGVHIIDLKEVLGDVSSISATAYAAAMFASHSRRNFI